MQPTAEFAEPFAELPDAVEDTWGEEEVAETDDQHHGVRTIVLPATSDRPSTIEQSFVVEPECHG